ncbi:hypothetical protein K438DRAFT_1987669 [Mycena galopus ATCC 62051]|nr:hypothetical protein K438DRAFT_1987669 [Mycena galopus ATCC 62051]
MQLHITGLLMIALALKVSARLPLATPACIKTDNQPEIFKGEDYRDTIINYPQGLQIQGTYCRKRGEPCASTSNCCPGLDCEPEACCHAL